MSTSTTLRLTVLLGLIVATFSTIGVLTYAQGNASHTPAVITSLSQAPHATVSTGVAKSATSVTKKAPSATSTKAHARPDCTGTPEQCKHCDPTNPASFKYWADHNTDGHTSSKVMSICHISLEEFVIG